ncbi:hypothetical protein CspeluHIS016_0500460 [Cutaneotrichosporon spelunceum]|uniref:Invertebrate defensins family profile domain-containing protein n=1 Tax=Cutaneotrichosporon spelunceum TaxID=1672016 RepID=A0AAD3YDK5_9TREE|nr:hypothetical protein CspeluHIS016_0500460 [Cutaneotrichosporon spelunceum]
MKFAIATAFALLASVVAAAPAANDAPATNAVYFAETDETCTAVGENVTCVPGRTPGSTDAATVPVVLFEDEDDIEKRALEPRQMLPCWGRGGAARCRAKCRRLGRCGGVCHGFIGPTCVCRKC